MAREGVLPANKVPTLVGCFCPLTAATIANAVEGFRGPLCRPFNKLRADVPHALKAIRELTMLGNPRYVRGCDSLLQAAGRARCPARVAGAVLVAGVAATIGSGASLATAAPQLSALSAEGP